MSFLRIDHVQITVPRAREREARRFYGEVLGLRELQRPTTVPAAGLCFDVGDSTQLHLILMENPFRPPLGDHFALVVDDLEAFKERLAGHSVSYNTSPVQDGHERIFVHDPFGNKMEFISRSNGSSLG